jgi:hypothetical protein
MTEKLALGKAGYSQRGTGEWIIPSNAKVTMREQQPGLYEIEIQTRLGSLIIRANAKDIQIEDVT